METNKPILSYSAPIQEPSYTTAPWRAVLAVICAILAAFSGPMSVDPYFEYWEYIAPSTLIVVALTLAWRATRSKVRWDRMLGYPLLVVLAVFVIYLFVDRRR